MTNTSFTRRASHRFRRPPAAAVDEACTIRFDKARTYAAPADAVLPSFADLVPGVVVGTLTHTTRHSTWFDAEDLRLMDEDVAVRRDVADGRTHWVVVGPAGFAEGDPVRREYVFRDESEHPAHYPAPHLGPHPVPHRAPAAVRRLVHALLGHAQLHAVASGVERRLTVPLLGPGEVHLADIADVHLDVVRDDGREEVFREVDVAVHDLDGVGGRLLARVDRRLSRAGFTPEPAVTDLTRAFGPPAQPSP